jgi:hypothetical protein
MTDAKYRMMRCARPVLAAAFLFVAIGCAPEVGSEAWCERMDETPKGDWTANQAADYARHCVFN